MKNTTNLFKRIRNIIVGNTLPKNEDLWLDTSNGEKNASLKYKGNPVGGTNIEGVGDPSNSGKVVGYDENGNLVPVNSGGGGGGGSVPGNDGDILQSDGEGGIVANDSVTISASGKLTAEGFESNGNISALSDITASNDITAGNDLKATNALSVEQDASVGNDLTVKYDIKTTNGNLFIGSADQPAHYIAIWSPNQTEYHISVDNNGQLTVTQV